MSNEGTVFLKRPSTGMTGKAPVVDECPKKVTEIHFGVFSTQETKQLSVVELFERDLYNIGLQSRPPTTGNTFLASKIRGSSGSSTGDVR